MGKIIEPNYGSGQHVNNCIVPSLNNKLNQSRNWNDVVVLPTTLSTLFPYTAKKDGIMSFTVAPGTASMSYIIVSYPGNTVAAASSQSGAAYSLEFPVVKNKVYSVTSYSNAERLHAATFYSL